MERATPLRFRSACTLADLALALVNAARALDRSPRFQASSPSVFQARDCDGHSFTYSNTHNSMCVRQERPAARQRIVGSLAPHVLTPPLPPLLGRQAEPALVHEHLEHSRENASWRHHARPLQTTQTGGQQKKHRSSCVTLAPRSNTTSKNSRAVRASSWT